MSSGFSKNLRILEGLFLGLFRRLSLGLPLPGTLRMASKTSGAYMAVGPTYFTGSIFARFMRDFTVSGGKPKESAISLTVNSSIPQYREKKIKN
jgi:hypothetical protein